MTRPWRCAVDCIGAVSCLPYVGAMYLDGHPSSTVVLSATVLDKKNETALFCEKWAFWLFGFSLVKLLKIHFFFSTKMLLSSRAFQISSFRRERFNRSKDMYSRSAFTHPTSEKLIAGLKLAIAIFNPVRVEGDRVGLPGFTGHFIPWEGRIFTCLWVERESLALREGAARRGV